MAKLIETELQWFKKLGPRAQGYVSYMKPELPQECPFTKGSNEAKEFERGQMDAVIEAQDCDE